MSNKVCGIEVDADLFKKYMERKYKILDKEVGLNIIEIYATSNEFKTNVPEITEEALKIREEVRNEIKTYYEEKDGRKEYKEVRYKKFSGYLGELKELFLQASLERENIKNKILEIEKVWKNADKMYGNDEYNHAKAKAEFVESKREQEDAINTLNEKYKKSISNIRAEFEKHLNDFYTPNGLRIDKATVDLLNSGIKLDGAEINSILTGFMGNPTMLRIISDYCETNNIKGSNALVFGKVVKENGKKEKVMFEEVAKMVSFVTGNDEQKVNIWTMESNRNWYSKAVDAEMEKIDNLIIRPQVHEG